MPHHDPVVAEFFDVHGIGAEVSEKGEMEELTAISVFLVQDAIADVYTPGESATLYERAAITCVVFVVCGWVSDRLRLDDDSPVDSTALSSAVWTHVMSHHSFSIGLLWAEKLEKKKGNKTRDDAAVALGEPAIALFRAPCNSDCVVNLRSATNQFCKELLPLFPRAD